ncbi:amino acid/amide ABC transporter substrate-binding protein, HAAT family [Sphingomonas guangdongensis]|uniref:Amino acid/amide ABC transporter substrate-binding protein, HAAT family n=1 Tax=Sphingomonas guangdongensis TaxID=1141890 RepID=A0A285QYY4_9SPHN|nr:amino acid/amide ABC transporter substrate-binding protein, HAAT family [Sphingomonas guangdongensis]
MNRRDALKLLRSGLVVSAASSIHPLFAAARKKRDNRPVALLLPLSGERAALGLSMQRAAALAESGGGTLLPLDTAGTATGASAAAQAALKRGAAMILGPLTSWEASAAAGVVAGRVPVLAFTNNMAAAASGAFVFGLTPAQTTTAVLRYARSRGVRSVTVVGDGSAWSNGAAESAVKAQGAIGLDVRVVTVTAGAPLPAVGEAPDAVLVPGSGEAVLAAARSLKETGVQLLGTVQALDYRPSALEALDGAWIAAPDPKAFGGFASDYEGRNGGDPGTLAALAYDAARIVEVLRAANTLSRDGLLAADSFPCVTGAVRFRTDGSCARDLAILVASRDGYGSVAVSRGA